jgi:hypothetical protein
MVWVAAQDCFEQRLPLGLVAQSKLRLRLQK